MSVTLARLVDGDATRCRKARARLPIAGLTADSREVKPGFVFAALPGSTVDGAHFIPQAIAAGAVAVLAGSKGRCGGAVLVIAHGQSAPGCSPAWRRASSAAQPDLVVAVTGTNGKTSVAAFVRQIWRSMGFRAASLGTIGVVGALGRSEYLAHTTPDPVKLHATLARLADDM